MARQGVAFGGHGAEHQLLTYVLARRRADTRFEGSRSGLRGASVEPLLTFSYPNGYLNDGRLSRRCGRAGYRLAFITRRGRVTCEDDPLTMRRLNIHEAMTDTAPMFLARLVGLW